MQQRRDKLYVERADVRWENQGLSGIEEEREIHAQ